MRTRSGSRELLLLLGFGTRERIGGTMLPAQATDACIMFAPQARFGLFAALLPDLGEELAAARLTQSGPTHLANLAVELAAILLLGGQSTPLGGLSAGLGTRTATCFVRLILLSHGLTFRTLPV